MATIKLSDFSFLKNQPSSGSAIYDDGDEFYWKNGVFHRDPKDGPAVIYKGVKYYMWYGKYHRHDGPAVIRAKNNWSCYRHGVEGDFARYEPRGAEQYELNSILAKNRERVYNFTKIVSFHMPTYYAKLTVCDVARHIAFKKVDDKIIYSFQAIPFKPFEYDSRIFDCDNMQFWLLKNKDGEELYFFKNGPFEGWAKNQEEFDEQIKPYIEKWQQEEALKQKEKEEKEIASLQALIHQSNENINNAVKRLKELGVNPTYSEFEVVPMTINDIEMSLGKKIVICG